VGGALWVAWAVVAAIMPAIFPAGPRPALALFLLVPLSLLAARCLLHLADRVIPARRLLWLGPATVVVLAWAGSPEIRASILALRPGMRPTLENLGTIVLVSAGMVGMLALIPRLDRWAQRDDGRRRLALAVFISSVLGLTILTGLREVQFRHRETLDLLQVRGSILRRHEQRKFTVLVVLGPDAEGSVFAPDQVPGEEVKAEPSGVRRETGSRAGWAAGAQQLASIGLRPSSTLPGGRLRFVLRSALPHLAQIDLAHVDDLVKLPDGQRLVILAGSETRLSYALQARLRLESLHPDGSGLLDVYATPIDPPKPRTARGRETSGPAPRGG
jgi:hypothetical protein